MSFLHTQYSSSGNFPSRIDRRHSPCPSVIVIGGGISGVAAARALQNASFKVVLPFTVYIFYLL